MKICVTIEGFELHIQCTASKKTAAMRSVRRRLAAVLTHLAQGCGESFEVFTGHTAHTCHTAHGAAGSWTYTSTLKMNGVRHKQMHVLAQIARVT